MRITIIIGLCLLVAVPALADFYAGTANVTKTSGYYDSSSNDRGEYTISNTSLNISGYVADVTSLGSNSFQTFCVERYEGVSNPSQVVVSTTFADGTEGSRAIYGNEYPNGDDLNAETAYLYTLFATGNLVNLGTDDLGRYSYDYDPDATRGASARSLQLAVWQLEEGLDFDDPAADAWTAAAQAAVASTAWTGIGSVRVLNMYMDPGLTQVAQDYLYYVPVPGAVLLGFLGLGAAGLKLRKFA